jgi:hypothetical protein
MKYHTIILAIATLVSGANVSNAQEAQNLPSDVSRVIAQRDAEIKKINQRCVIELERLKVSYTKRGDLKNALLVDNVIKEMKIPHHIVGNWMFVYEGRSFPYMFREDGSISGNYVTGGGFNGTWKAEGDKVVIRREDGSVFSNISMSDENNPIMKTLDTQKTLYGKKND